MFDIQQVADSFAFLKTLADGSVDVVFTDPPYDAHCQSNQTSGTMMKELLTGKRKGGIPKKDLKFDPLKDYAFTKDLVRVAKRWALVFGTLEAFGPVREINGADYVRGGVWYKPNAMGQLTADRPASCYEGISILHRKDLKKRWNGKGSYGFWPCNSTRGKKDRHDNEKPLDLCLKLVALFSERGETVLDPFCGSGAIGEACILLDRNYIGLDSDLDWVERAIRRCQLAQDISTGRGYLDAHALSLCTAKKSEILEDAALANVGCD